MFPGVNDKFPTVDSRVVLPALSLHAASVSTPTTQSLVMLSKMRLASLGGKVGSVH
jgi:hypothetical protein